MIGECPICLEEKKLTREGLCKDCAATWSRR